MNILLANSTCKVGGVSTFLLTLRDELMAQGHHCSLFFFEHGSMDPLLPPDADVRFGTLADCLRLVAQKRIDVVHANNVDWPTGISAVRRLGAKLVLTAHKVREPAWAYGWHTGNCDAFVTVSEWIREALEPFTDLPIHVVPNGIDTARFAPRPAPAGLVPIVAWVGRGGAARKRLEHFAEVAPALARAGLRVWVIDPQGAVEFAAVHPHPAAMLATAAEVWRGASAAQMPDVYAAVAASGGCVVSTATMEGLPLALLEAQACGCRVVAADVPGVRECVSPSHGGVLYPLAATPAETARVILEATANRQTVREAQRATAAYARDHFSLRTMARAYLAIYDGLPPGSRGTHRRRVPRSPFFHWKAYAEDRLGVGYTQYEASRTLVTSGHDITAAAAADEALVTAPTIYLHPKRLSHLLRVHLPASRSRLATETDVDSRYEETVRDRM